MSTPAAVAAAAAEARVRGAAKWRWAVPPAQATRPSRHSPRLADCRRVQVHLEHRGIPSGKRYFRTLGAMGVRFFKDGMYKRLRRDHTAYG